MFWVVPLDSGSHEGFGWDSESCGKILSVTITGKGDNPRYVKNINQEKRKHKYNNMYNMYHIALMSLYTKIWELYTVY